MSLPTGHDLALISTSQLLRLPDPEWLMDRVLPLGAVSVIYGQPETGKSFIALDWAMCISEGMSWLGVHKTKQTPVIYIAAEGGTGIKKRVSAWMKHYARTTLDAMHWQVVPLLIREEGVLERTLDRLDDDVTGINPGLIVFDTLSRSFSNGDENASTDMVHFVDKIIDLSTRKGTAALIVHHTNAAGTRERGHGSLRGNVNTMFRCISTQNGDRKLVHVCLENDKQKDDAKLADVHLDVQLVGTSLVLVAGEVPEKKQKSASEKAFMRRADMLNVLGTAPDGLTFEEWRLACGGIPKSSFSRSVAWHSKQGNIEKDGFKYVVPMAGADIVDLAEAEEDE